MHIVIISQPRKALCESLLIVEPGFVEGIILRLRILRLIRACAHNNDDKDSPSVDLLFFNSLIPLFFWLSDFLWFDCFAVLFLCFVLLCFSYVDLSFFVFLIVLMCLCDCVCGYPLLWQEYYGIKFIFNRVLNTYYF